MDHILASLIGFVDKLFKIKPDMHKDYLDICTQDSLQTKKILNISSETSETSFP